MPEDLAALTANLRELFKPKTVERFADIIKGNEAFYMMHADRCDLDGMVRTFTTRVCTMDKIEEAADRRISKRIREKPEEREKMRKLSLDIRKTIRDMREEAAKRFADDFEKCTLKFLEAIRKK
jgi:Fe-S-cluster formation regulator IscX/YfhJ